MPHSNELKIMINTIFHTIDNFPCTYSLMIQQTGKLSCKFCSIMYNIHIQIHFSLLTENNNSKLKFNQNAGFNFNVKHICVKKYDKQQTLQTDKKLIFHF